MKTNSKKASNNIRQYIIDNADFDGYSKCADINGNDFEQVATAIYGAFWDEVGEYRTKIGYTRQQAFEYWAQGLPSILDTCYYYNRSAVDDLSKILEQEGSTKAKYSEQQAEKTLTYLIYREITKGARV